MNKRETMLNLIHGKPLEYTPAAFFMHFDPAYHTGQPAIDKHLEYFRATGMDFVKIQYEQKLPPAAPIRAPEDWAQLPVLPASFYDSTLRVVEGLVKAAHDEALVVLTVYSPFMLAMQQAGPAAADMAQHLHENSAPVVQGLANMTANVVNLVRGCKDAGVDGFYISTQGGETFRFPASDFFTRYIKPTDLAVWNEVEDCVFNILHICDYVAGYDDLAPFLDYPGHVVNCSLKLGDRTLRPVEIARQFGRPFMGGLERKGLIASGPEGEIVAAVHDLLTYAPDRFILAADCTVPSDTPWANLKAAIDAAHHFARPSRA